MRLSLEPLFAVHWPAKMDGVNVGEGLREQGSATGGRPPVRNVHRVDGVAVVSLTAYADDYLITTPLRPRKNKKNAELLSPALQLPIVLLRCSNRS